MEAECVSHLLGAGDSAAWDLAEGQLCLCRCFHWSVMLLLFLDCLMSQQQAKYTSGMDLQDSFACCHTEIQVTDLTCCLIQSQYIDFSPSTDSFMPGAWQGSC